MTNSVNSPDLELECPTCGERVLWNKDYPFRPFCSQRCQLVDFGEWANESHRIDGGEHEEQDLDDWEK